MKKNVKEFIDSEGNLIGGDKPNLNPNTTAKHTTDKTINQSRMPYNFSIYSAKLQENDMEFSKKADEFKEDPKKFYEYLKGFGKEDKFLDYFERKDQDNQIKEKLKEAAKRKAYEMMEDILKKKKQDKDVINKNKVTIEDIKEKEPALFKKYERLIETLKDELNHEEKMVLVNHFKNKMK